MKGHESEMTQNRKANMKCAQKVTVIENGEHKRNTFIFIGFNNQESLIFLLLILYVYKAQSHAYLYVLQENKHWKL